VRDWLYRRLPAVLMARRNLTRARARAILAILCIIIGVAAIGSLGLFGSAFKRDQLERFGEFGNDVQVRAGEDIRGLNERHLQEIERAAPGAKIVPIKQQYLRVRSGGTTQYVGVYGVENAEALYDAKRGRIPSQWRKRALVGSEIAKVFDLEPGSSVRIDGTTYRVAAVLENKGFAGIAAPRYSIVLPSERVDTEEYDQFVVRTDSSAAANATAQRIDAQMNGRKQRVRVVERGQIRETIDTFFATLNVFLMGIGAISLLVAGISILNVMLMSAIERREEIGVLRAVGYQKLDIMRVMLAESAALGFVGSLAGVLLSLAAGAVIQDFLLNAPLAFDRLGLSYVGGALVVGVVVSVVAGLYPAWKAANERPVEALRH
jgi:putative ABC transport system permease protein